MPCQKYRRKERIAMLRIANRRPMQRSDSVPYLVIRLRSWRQGEPTTAVNTRPVLLKRGTQHWSRLPHTDLLCDARQMRHVEAPDQSPRVANTSAVYVV